MISPSLFCQKGFEFAIGFAAKSDRNEFGSRRLKIVRIEALRPHPQDSVQAKDFTKEWRGTQSFSR